MNKKNIKYLQRKITGSSIFNLLEKIILKRNVAKYPPIFIIGLPRSGSTLLYQLLINRYRLSYFSNLSNFFYKSPVMVSKILSYLNYRYKSEELKSEFGLVKGICSPSECGSIFRYWFNKLPYNEDTINKIRNSIQNVSHIEEAPFIVKNLYNNFRIEKLNEIFPEAFFINIQREPIFVAQSLLIARKKNNGLYSEWFGLKPVNYDEILKIKDPFLQVYNQINSINATIRDVISNKKINIVEVDYSKLCEDTEQVLSGIINKYNFLFDAKLKKNNLRIKEIKSEDFKKLNDPDWKKLYNLFIN